MSAATLLTPREVQVIQLLAEGLTNAEIGRRLYLSTDTIKTHLRRINAKLGTRSRAETVAWCLRDGVIR